MAFKTCPLSLLIIAHILAVALTVLIQSVWQSYFLPWYKEKFYPCSILWRQCHFPVELLLKVHNLAFIFLEWIPCKDCQILLLPSGNYPQIMFQETLGMLWNLFYSSTRITNCEQIVWDSTLLLTKERCAFPYSICPISLTGSETNTWYKTWGCTLDLSSPFMTAPKERTLWFQSTWETLLCWIFLGLLPEA